MKSATTRKWLAGIILAAAVVMILVGSARSFKIYEETKDDWGIQTFVRISEKDLIIDTTFSGLALKSGKLYSTYDRSKSAGKRDCPT